MEVFLLLFCGWTTVVPSLTGFLDTQDLSSFHKVHLCVENQIFVSSYASCMFTQCMYHIHACYLAACCFAFLSRLL